MSVSLGNGLYPKTGAFKGSRSSEMLRLAAEAYFKTRDAQRTKYQTRFAGLLGEYIQYSNRRNEIAHGCVKNMFVTERKTAKGHRIPALGFYLLPSFYNPKKYKNEAFTYVYTSSDLIHYRQEFTKLSLRIGALYADMRPKRKA
jgi:hypothetical protein